MTTATQTFPSTLLAARKQFTSFALNTVCNTTPGTMWSETYSSADFTCGTVS